ncbi:hypothetical protein [Anaerosporobacter faecicola]|uniref:hypothetical protein n=1 Tax=Anaerosporobacter faecicola TaxID=2718714 RepID=UPI001439923C|nr:hypothetical protein [Anaerosporobacter faecicola]
MIIKDLKGNELLDIIQIDENRISDKYTPLTHALVVVKIGEEYLMGGNHFRKDWEISLAHFSWCAFSFSYNISY